MADIGRLPAGVQDIYGAECAHLQRLRAVLTHLFERGGYAPVKTAALEYYDTYARIGNAVPQERMFKLSDTDGKLLVLRPDVTLAISRLAATKLPAGGARLYYFADKWDLREAGGIWGREVYQAGVERLGEEGAFSDAQTVAFAIECLQAAGLKNFIVDIGHVGFFKGLLQECGLSGDEAEEVRSYVNGKDSFGAERALRKAGAAADAVNAVLTLPTLFGGAEVLERAQSVTHNEFARSALAHLKEVYALLSDMGYAEYLRFDLGAVKSLSYYSGVIFSGLVEKLGAPVLSGGRYDRLADDFGKNIPAVGFALGLKRILTALERQGGLLAPQEAEITIVCERGAEGRAYREYLRLTGEGKRVCLSAVYGKEGERAAKGRVVTIGKENF